jgi:hypothetical protein
VWPAEAAEWVTRTRRHGWPPQSLVDQVVQNGCHFVAVGHKHSLRPETEFRFSFSSAERLLVQSWLPIQKYIYSAIKLIGLKTHSNEYMGAKYTHLCSYYVKTLMLWSCEEKPPEFWAENQQESSVQQLLYELIECLIDRRCPNYFLRENNMMDHISQDEDLSEVVCFISNIAQNVSVYVSKADYTLRMKTHLLVRLPRWLVITNHIMNSCIQVTPRKDPNWDRAWM